MTGIVVFAHGSSIESANEAVRSVAIRMAKQGGYSLLEAAFLEGGEPDLNGSIENLIAKGADRIVVIPYFLTLGLHLQRDLPKLVNEIRSAHPGLIEIKVTEPLDGHPALTQILLDRAVSAC